MPTPPDSPSQRTVREPECPSGPIDGQPVRLRLEVRRFFSDNPMCTARTFAEQPAARHQPRQRAAPAAGYSDVQVTALPVLGSTASRCAASTSIGARIAHAVGRAVLQALAHGRRRWDQWLLVDRARCWFCSCSLGAAKDAAQKWRSRRPLLATAATAGTAALLDAVVRRRAGDGQGRPRMRLRVRAPR